MARGGTGRCLILRLQNLRVWQHSIELATEVYGLTASFPRHELYSLAQQMRRAAVSVPSNIAEGKGRGTARGFRQFLYQARGSLLELQTHVVIAERRTYLSQEQAAALLDHAAQIGRSLSGLINAISDKVA